MSTFAAGKKILFAVVILAWPTFALANIGDDVGKLRARYGSAKDMGAQLLFEVRLNNDGQLVPAGGAANPETHLTVTVSFDGNHSAMEIFTRNTSDPSKVKLSQQEIDEIMEASGDGLKWNSVQLPSGKPAWVRADNKLIARFSPGTGNKADDGPVLVIMLNTK